jgi:hypothetical protein
MNAHLTYIMVDQRSAELQRAGERARLVSKARQGRRQPPHPNLITRAGAQLGRRGPRAMTALEVEPGIGSER